MKTAQVVESQSDLSNESDDEGFASLRCYECEVNFTSQHYLYSHLYHHIKQPFVKLDRIQPNNPPLKITFKNRSGNSFEIVSSPASSVTSDSGSRSATLDDYLGEQNSLSADDQIVKEEQTVKEETEDQQLVKEEEEEQVAQQESGEEEQVPKEEEEEEEEEQEEGEPADNDLDIRDHQDQADHDPFEGIESESPELQEDLQEGDDSDDKTNVRFSPNFADIIGGEFLADVESPAAESEKVVAEELGGDKKEEDKEKGDKRSDTTAGVDAVNNGNNANPEYGGIPGAEPTPPPEPSPTGATEYPKIKIKTTGLFKDPEPQRCTITEITDDNPTGDPSMGNALTPIWTTPSLEDPLKLPDNDDNNLMSLFNNNDRAKDLGFSTSNDNEFISLDRFDERNRGAMQLYNPNSTMASSTSLDSITGLPMQALAQQVSRLQPNGNQGMHQQNVLINIQQFPSGPPQPTYQHPPMYPHYPPHPGQPPMHQPYQYQPPSPMYYPPAPGYPPQHMPPPPPQMGQMQHPPPMGQQPQMGVQPPNSMVPSSQGQPMPSQMQQPQQGGYRQPMPPKAPVPRGPQPGAQRMPMGPRGGQMNQRAPMTRPRAPMVRPRGGGVQAARGGVRPRMSGPHNGIRPGQQASPVKRNPEQITGGLQAKKKRLDVLTPSDKDDDDCQVICMQPKNTDGGLPQIESVQGGTSESAESSIMHLSDSITLSVRNPPPKPVVAPQKSDAKAVANILATRGITVTATAKPKEKDSPQKSPVLPTSLSLNGAVSIVASAKGNGSPAKPVTENLPTVDLTDDTPLSKSATSPQKNRPGLPYRCDLCPAQYPNATGLNKHRQTYHKTTGGMCELGVPLINLKQAGIMQRLSQLGITNYIPLPSTGPDGTFALPIISTKQPGNMAALGATQMLSLGPVRSIPKPTPGNNVNAANKPMNK